MSDILVESDRVPMSLLRYAVIPQGTSANVAVTFSIPQDLMFWAQRLELIPQVRSVPLDGSTPARVYNRAAWTYETGAPFEGDLEVVSSPALDVLWRISTSVDGVSRDYQNVACSIPLLFGASPSGWAQRAYPSALEFDQEWYLPGGSSMTVTLTPTYTDAAVAPDFYEYRVVCILSGSKEVF